MPGDFELNYRVGIENADQLSALAAKQRDVGLQAKFGADQIAQFETNLKSAMGAGFGYQTALEGMAASGMKVAQSVLSTTQAVTANTQSILSGTAAIVPAMAQTEQAAGRVMTGFTQARYSAQLLGRELGVPLPRALSSIASQAAGLGPILQAAFPVIGAIAFGQVLAQIVEKVYDYAIGLNKIKEFNETIAKTIEEQGKKAEELGKQVEQAQLKIRGATMGPAAEELAKSGLLGRAVDRDKQAITDLEAHIKQTQARIARDSGTTQSVAIFGGAKAYGMTFGQAGQANAKDLTDAQNQLRQDNAAAQVARAQLTRDMTVGAADRAEYEKDHARDLRRDDAAAARAERPEERYQSARTRMQESASASGLGPIGSAQRERDAFISQWSSIAGPGRASRDAQGAYNERLGFGANGQLQPGQGILGDYARTAQRSMEEEVKRNEEAFKKGGWMGNLDEGQSKLFEDRLRTQNMEAEERRKDQEKQRQDIQMSLQSQSGFVTRAGGERGRLLGISGDQTPTTDYAGAMEMANQLLALKAQEISMEEDLDKRSMDAKRAIYDYIKEQDEARIAREEKIAAISEQQAKETGSLLSGLADAAISGQPNATAKYMTGIGRSMFSKGIANVGEMGGGLQNYIGLGKTGMLGSDPEHRNILGQFLKGSMFDFSSKQYGADPAKETAEQAKVIAINTGKTVDLLGGTHAVPSSGSGSSGASYGGGGGGGSPMAALRSMAGFPSLSGGGGGGGMSSYDFISQGGLPSAPAFRGGGGGGGGLSSYDFISQGGLPGAPSFGGGGSSGLLSALLNPPSVGGGMGIPGGTGPGSAYSYISGGGLPSASQFGTASGMGNFKFPSTMDTASNTISSLAKLANSIGGKGGKAGGFFGGFGSGMKDSTSGYGVEDLFNGTAGSMSQKFGDIAGLAGQVGGGALQAIKGFGSGGVRGDLSGIAGTAMAVAPFAGPAAPFIDAGASLVDMISSLLPDPRIARQKQETEALLSKAYIQPAAHNYSFSASGGGTSGAGSSQGGAAFSGGPISVNLTQNLSAVDAKSVYELLQSNPSAASQLMLTGMTAGGNTALGQVISYIAANGSI